MEQRRVLFERRPPRYTNNTMNAAPILHAAGPDPAGATPVMVQFFAAKQQQPDALVFFRMGDFYELFFDDAKKAAEALGIALTYRGKHAGEDIPMCGVPVHAAEAYLAKLIRSGFRVAVCEQMENPKEARARGSKSIVRRELVRVVTPGTLTEDSLLDARGANRLAAVAVRGGRAALASVELSTGEVESLVMERGELASALSSLRPSEILAPDRLFADEAAAAALKACGAVVQPMPAALAELGAAKARVERLYGVATLDGFGAFEPVEVSALGLIAAHLETTQGGKAPMLRPPRRSEGAETMAIDPATRTSLEIERSQSGGREGSLLACIDRTVTAPGARMLADRLARPLIKVDQLTARLDAVELFAERGDLRADVRGMLRQAADMARALSRLGLGRGGPRDLGALRSGLLAGEALAALFAGASSPLEPLAEEVAGAVAAL